MQSMEQALLEQCGTVRLCVEQGVKQSVVIRFVDRIVGRIVGLNDR